ncbi:MAG: hypothetical protein HY023_09440 [Chloroflexi bacterium]|nr:hypothetical protein [Chloroflexota bacterium]
MEKLVLGLGPAFAAGFAVQQLLELLDPLLTRFGSSKRFAVGLIALTFSLVLSFGANLRVLVPLGATAVPVWADGLVTALLISAGTEGFNSVLKFLDYAKQNAKKAALQ